MRINGQAAADRPRQGGKDRHRHCQSSSTEKPTSCSACHLGERASNNASLDARPILLAHTKKNGRAGMMYARMG